MFFRGYDPIFGGVKIVFKLLLIGGCYYHHLRFLNTCMTSLYIWNQSNLSGLN